MHAHSLVFRRCCIAGYVQIVDARDRGGPDWPWHRGRIRWHRCEMVFGSTGNVWRQETALVLAARNVEMLEPICTTVSSKNAQCLVVQTDVSIESECLAIDRDCGGANMDNWMFLSITPANQRKLC